MNPSATKFDLGNANACARASAMAYRAAPTLANATTDTQVVIDPGATVLVSFRGTTNLRDWLTDVQCTKRLLVEEANGDQCEVHHGFLDGAESILGDLIRILGGYKNRPLVVTGHSLGGALAILAALELQRMGFNVEQVYTFGQPRVGNKCFAQLYNVALGDRTFAVANEGDPVPLVPTLLMGYRDCGTEIFLKRNGTMQVNPFIGAALFADVFGFWRSWREHELAFLSNHFLAEYQERLKGLA